MPPVSTTRHDLRGRYSTKTRGGIGNVRHYVIILQRSAGPPVSLAYLSASRALRKTEFLRSKGAVYVIMCDGVPMTYEELSAVVASRASG